MRFTHDQMLAHWRRHLGYEDARLDCSIEVSEGINITERLSVGMRQWYLNLLDTAEPRFLSLKNEVARISAGASEARGVVTAKLPADVRRVISVTIDGTTYDTPCAEAIAVAVANRYDARPAWTVTDDRTLIITTNPSDTPKIDAIWCVTDPGDEYYDLDEAALSLIVDNHDTSG